MDIDEIITLDDETEYVLLLKTVLDNNKYFLASKIVGEQASEEYAYFREITDSNMFLVEDVEDLTLIDRLKKEFVRQIKSEG